MKYEEIEIVEIIQQLLNGLTVGGIYALIALGYTMVYGIIKLINFAHGDIFMIGAFAGFFAVTLITDLFIGTFAAAAVGAALAEYKLITAIISSIIFCGLLGLFVERVAYRPLREGSPKTIIGSAIGLAFIIFAAVFGKGGFQVDTALLFLVILGMLSILSFAYIRYAGNNIKSLSKESINQKIIVYSVLYITAFIILAYLSWYFDITTMVFVSFAFALLVYWLVVSRVKSTNAGGNSRINALISAIGMSMILSNMVMLLRGTSDQPYRMGFFTGTINVGTFSVSSLQIFIIVFSFILMGILFYIIHKTKFGLSMRAVSHNLNAARLMGINPDKVIAMTFVIGSALAGVAGVLVGTYYQSVSPNIGMMYGLKAFVAAVLGGIGSIPGAVVGGIVLGIAEVVGIAFLSSSYKDAIAFGILILILIIKPTGIFGKTMKEKV